jgi:CysZ protein
MMIVSEIFQGIIAYFQAMQVGIKHKLYKYLFLLLFLLLIFIVPVFIFDFFISLIGKLIPYSETDKYIDSGINFMASISGFFLLLVLSPVFTMVSEDITQKLKGKIYKFSFLQILKDVGRAVKLTSRNLIYQYFAIALISISIHFLPQNQVIAIFGKVLLFLITSYFFGFSLLDFAMENHRMSYKESVQFVRTHIGLSIGLGSVYYIAININQLTFVKEAIGHTSLYWSSFSEAIIAFIGVIAASIIMLRVGKTSN